MAGEREENAQDHVPMPRKVANFLIDTDDDECPDFSLHMAALNGDCQKIEQILAVEENKDLLRHAL